MLAQLYSWFFGFLLKRQEKRAYSNVQPRHIDYYIVQFDGISYLFGLHQKAQGLRLAKEFDVPMRGWWGTHYITVEWVDDEFNGRGWCAVYRQVNSLGGYSTIFHYHAARTSLKDSYNDAQKWAQEGKLPVVFWSEEDIHDAETLKKRCDSFKYVPLDQTFANLVASGAATLAPGGTEPSLKL